MEIDDAVIHAVSGKRGCVTGIGNERIPRVEVEWEDGKIEWLTRDMVRPDTIQVRMTASTPLRKKAPVKSISIPYAPMVCFTEPLAVACPACGAGITSWCLNDGRQRKWIAGAPVHMERIAAVNSEFTPRPYPSKTKWLENDRARTASQTARKNQLAERIARDDRHDDPQTRTPEEWAALIPKLGKWAFKNKGLRAMKVEK